MDSTTSDEIVQELTALMRRALANDESLETFVQAHTALEAYAQRAADPTEVTPLRRAIHGNLLTVAQVKKVPAPACKPFFDRVWQLGFHDAQDEMLQVGAYARYCLRNGQPELMRSYLSESLERCRGKLSEEFMAIFEKLLAEMSP